MLACAKLNQLHSKKSLAIPELSLLHTAKSIRSEDPLAKEICAGISASLKIIVDQHCSEIERMQGDVRLLQLQMIKSRQDLEGVTNTPWKEAITKFINFSTLNHKMPLESATGSGIGFLADCAELFP